MTDTITAETPLFGIEDRVCLKANPALLGTIASGPDDDGDYGVKWDEGQCVGYYRQGFELELAPLAPEEYVGKRVKYHPYSDEKAVPQWRKDCTWTDDVIAVRRGRLVVGCDTECRITGRRALITIPIEAVVEVVPQ